MATPTKWGDVIDVAAGAGNVQGVFRTSFSESGFAVTLLNDLAQHKVQFVFPDGSLDGPLINDPQPGQLHHSTAQTIGLIDGSTVEIWAGTDFDLINGHGLYAQTYNSSGTATTGEVLLADGNISEVSVTGLSNSGAAISWTLSTQAPGDPFPDLEVRAQVFDLAFAAIGADFVVPTVTTNQNLASGITQLSAGRSVVIWSNTFTGTIEGQIIAANGALEGSEFTVNTTTAGDQNFPVIHSLPGGGFVAVWTDDGTFTGGGTNTPFTIRGQVFNDNGTLNGSEFVVGTSTPYAPTPSSFPGSVLPQVEALNDGRFVVTWWDEQGAASPLHTKAQIFDTRTQAVTAYAGSAGDDQFAGTKFDDTLGSGNGNDRLYGYDGADQLNGGANDDLLYGGAGIDTLVGGSGNDGLDGGADADTAQFAGAQDSYQIVRLATGWLVADTAPGANGDDGADILINIETLTFLASATSLNVADLIGRLSDSNVAANSVSEAASIGTTVGLTALAADGNSQAVSYQLLDDANGRFAIDAATGIVSVAASLDFETAASHVIAVRATSADGSFTDGSFTIAVTNVSPETMLGTAFADVLTGGSDTDNIFGFSGNDTLSGQGGNDTIVGGLGRDVMNGGIGNDDFIFNSKSETGISTSRRDLITDFHAFVDDIDVSGIDAKAGGGNQAFRFISKQAFHHKAGEMHYKFVGANTLLEGDINGDGRADLQIELTGHVALTRADLIL